MFKKWVSPSFFSQALSSLVSEFISLLWFFCLWKLGLVPYFLRSCSLLLILIIFLESSDLDCNQIIWAYKPLSRTFYTKYLYPGLNYTGLLQTPCHSLSLNSKRSLFYHLLMLLPAGTSNIRCCHTLKEFFLLAGLGTFKICQEIYL